MTGAEPDRPQDAGPADDEVGHDPVGDDRTRDDDVRDDPVDDDGTGDDDVRDDGPVIDPRDPLGLGDLATSGATGTSPAAPAAPAPDAPLADDAGPAEPVDGAPSTGADAPPLPPPTGPVPRAEVVEARASLAPGTASPGSPVDPPASTTAHDPPGGAEGDGASPGTTGTGEEPSSGGPGTDVAPGVVHQAHGPAAAGARPARSGWARLGHAMRPRTTQGQLITAGLCALLGFALVVQVRQTTDTQLGALRQNDLVRLLDETTTRTDELEQESRDLQRERDELLSGSDRQQAALDAARRTAAMQGILTGRLPATGPGVRITLTEPDGEIRPTTLLHVLEELRNAGAEAMELNGQRITASTAITGVRGAIEVDGTVITSPFRWTVIGDPDTIAPALEIPGGALARVRSDGGRGTVEKADRVDVEAVRELPDPVHATPDTDEG